MKGSMLSVSSSVTEEVLYCSILSIFSLCNSGRTRQFNNYNFIVKHISRHRHSSTATGGAVKMLQLAAQQDIDCTKVLL
jgi:hypothetical protein